MGAIWVIARIWYAIAYQKDPAKREGGFGLAMLTSIGLWLGALAASKSCARILAPSHGVPASAPACPSSEKSHARYP